MNTWNQIVSDYYCYAEMLDIFYIYEHFSLKRIGGRGSFYPFSSICILFHWLLKKWLLIVDVPHFFFFFFFFFILNMRFSSLIQTLPTSSCLQWRGARFLCFRVNLNFALLQSCFPLSFARKWFVFFCFIEVWMKIKRRAHFSTAGYACRLFSFIPQ